MGCAVPGRYPCQDHRASILDDTGDNFRLTEPDGLGQYIRGVISQHREAAEGYGRNKEMTEKTGQQPAFSAAASQRDDSSVTQKTTNTGRLDDTGDVVCFGEVLLRLSSPGKQLLLQTPVLQTQVGGAEANVAVSLSRFGHGTRM